MLSTIGLWGMVVFALLIFIDKDPFYLVHPKVEPKVEEPAPLIDQKMVKDIRMDTLIDSVTTLTRVAQSNFEALKAGQELSAGRVDKLEHKLEYLEMKQSAQKPPVIHFPEHLEVSIVKPVELKGAVNIATPKPLKVVHRPISTKEREAQFEQLKKQVKALSK